MPIDVRTMTPAMIRTYIDTIKATVWHSTPTAFRHVWANSGSMKRVQSIRRVVLGGEMTYARDLETFNGSFTDIALLCNGYGPTESTLPAQYLAPQVHHAPQIHCQ